MVMIDELRNQEEKTRRENQFVENLSRGRNEL